MINILTITDIVINNYIILNIPIIISIATNIIYFAVTKVSPIHNLMKGRV